MYISDSFTRIDGCPLTAVYFIRIPHKPAWTHRPCQVNSISDGILIVELYYIVVGSGYQSRCIVGFSFLAAGIHKNWYVMSLYRV